MAAPRPSDELRAERDKRPVVEPELAGKLLVRHADPLSVAEFDWRVFELVKGGTQAQRRWMTSRLYEVERGIECLESEEGRERLGKAAEQE